MAFTIFNSLATQILAPVKTAADISGTLVTWVTPLFLLGITLFLMSYGFDVVRGGAGSQYFLDALTKVTRPFVVLNLALAGGMYASSVVPFFSELRTSLSGLFGAKGNNSYQVIDSAMENVLWTLHTMVPYADQHISFVHADVSGLVMYVCMGITLLGMLFYGVVACINLLVVDASLAIVFGMGPLFVAAFAFQSTARFFDSWLSTALKYTLTAAFIAMVIGMANMLIGRFSTSIRADSEAMDFITLAATSIASAAVLIALLMRAPHIAAELVGGVSIELASGVKAANVAMGIGSATANGTARGGAFVAGAASASASRGASAAAGTPLGARVLRATESMRTQAAHASSTAGTVARNFGSAVRGVAPDGTTGHGAANAFRLGRQATSSATGTGTINGAGAGNGVRPVPKSEWRD